MTSSIPLKYLHLLLAAPRCMCLQKWQSLLGGQRHGGCGFCTGRASSAGQLKKGKDNQLILQLRNHHELLIAIMFPPQFLYLCAAYCCHVPTTISISLCCLLLPCSPHNFYILSLFCLLLSYSHHNFYLFLKIFPIFF